MQSMNGSNTTTRPWNSVKRYKNLSKPFVNKRLSISRMNAVDQDDL